MKRVGNNSGLLVFHNFKINSRITFEVFILSRTNLAQKTSWARGWGCCSSRRSCYPRDNLGCWVVVAAAAGVGAAADCWGRPRRVGPEVAAELAGQKRHPVLEVKSRHDVETFPGVYFFLAV